MTEHGGGEIKTALKNIAIRTLGGTVGSTIFAPFRKDVVPVFMLHRVHSPDAGIGGYSTDFMEQALSYLSRRHFNFVSLAQIVQCMNGDLALPKNAVVFTCDDGFWDQAEITAPLLEKYQCPLTIFLITGFIDGKLWPWDDRIRHVLNTTEKATITISICGQKQQLNLNSKRARGKSIQALHKLFKESDHSTLPGVLEELEQKAQVECTSRPPEAYRPMSWEQARALEQRNIQFAPHSVTHCILSKTSDATAAHEITHSWQRIKDELENPLPVFCYPTGRSSDFGTREIDLIKQAGLKLAVTTTPGYVNINSDCVADQRYRLNRFSFPDNMLDLIQYVSWIERFKEIVRRR